MKKYLILVLMGLLAIACQKSGIQPDPSTMPSGELIEVALNLQLDQPQAISRAQAQPTTCNQGAVEAEWSVAPIQTPTSKAVDDATVANVWVLQFNGTEANSTLINTTYVEDYVAGLSVPLFKATTANRVAIVANTFDAAWGNAFEEGTATWAQVSAASQTITAQSDLLRTYGGAEYLPMSGSSTGTLLVGSKLSVSLTRTVARVTIKIRPGADLKEPNMSVQMCNIPNATSWFPDMGTGVWPASPTLFNYPKEQLTEMQSTEYRTLTYWVPINRRGVVEGTVGFTRAMNAPEGATYLEVVSGSLTYTIHLGANFATDYNLRGNMAYSYELTLRTDPFGHDSRVSDTRNLGTLVLLPAGIVANTGGTVRVSTPSAVAGLVWTASLSNTKGFAVDKVTGTGSDASAVVTLSVNPTNAVRTSIFRAMELNGKSARITIAQAASSLAFESPSATTPVDYTATSATFTVTGTKGLELTFAKTGGDGAFITPADHTCDGTAQRVTVTMAANAGAARQATFSATVTNPGASGLDLKGITVKQVGRPINPPTPDQYVEIDGLRWTKGNLVAKNGNECKVGTATDHGLYFHFGSLVGWKGGANGDGVGAGTNSPAYATEVQVKPVDYSGGTAWTTVGYFQGGTTATKGYDLPTTDAPTTGIGDPCRYYLGAPWRTPTAAEWLTLLGAGGANTTGRAPLTVNNTALSFPASGNRDGSNGAFDTVGSVGHYWSSSVRGTSNGYHLYFMSSYVDPQYTYNSRSDGVPVRCVALL